MDARSCARSPLLAPLMQAARSAECAAQRRSAPLAPHTRSAAPHHSAPRRSTRLASSPRRATMAALPRGGAASSSSGHVTLGLDFGTSGARVTAVDGAGAVLADAKAPWPADAARDWPAAWSAALWTLLEGLPADVRAAAAAIAVDGTSASAMLVDDVTGAPLTAPLMYNDACPDAMPAVRAMAPDGHTVCAATSTLAKLLTWQAGGGVRPGAALAHQADWIAAQLHGQQGVTDWNNALKLGFDPAAPSAWPAWLAGSACGAALPRRVVAPGAAVAPLAPGVASRLGMRPDCMVAGGTTDSIAAFLAADVAQHGEAVTSLGSTLAVKLLSPVRVDSATHGVYSHRLGDAWLVGGASNTGGAALRSLFSDEQLRTLSARIDPATSSPLQYYPLLKPGERFPVYDPEMQPRMQPRPADDVAYLHGLLESMARIEAEAYRLLAALGAPRVTRVLTAGGGAANPQWTAIRERVIGAPVAPSAQGDAAYGAALLARRALR